MQIKITQELIEYAYLALYFGTCLGLIIAGIYLGNTTNQYWFILVLVGLFLMSIGVVIQILLIKMHKKNKIQIPNEPA